MKIIVGLGNQGVEYIGTRHNVGFDFVDELAKHPRLCSAGEELSFATNKKFQADIAETQVAGDKYILAKPQTFMNVSGKSVRSILDFYKASVNDLLVVSDDLDLPLGMARVRLTGSSGGHKGIENIISEIGTKDFARLRIGISDKTVGGTETDHPYEKPEAKIFVLEKFSDREKPIIKKMISKSVDIIVDCLTSGEELVATSFEA
ncbi:MAG: aminoacyl-tRNA hydrolase [Candidatus Berkelbacteria bacterium]|nr:aminoacyl-tRNA hydrolase [Candidatus Berkelbacteria bacterium]